VFQLCATQLRGAALYRYNLIMAKHQLHRPDPKTELREQEVKKMTRSRRKEPKTLNISVRLKEFIT
jgi:hypothetical protein